MTDIVCTIPWTCGFDDECERGWHLTHYWLNSDGGYSCCDEDGNHDPCDEADIPDLDEQVDAWRDYARFVAETGSDPLCQYNVRHTVRVRERWEVRLAPCIGGVLATDIRRAGRHYTTDDLPEYMLKWLNVRRGDYRARLHDFDSWEALVEAQPHVRRYVWTTFYVERDRPRAAAAVARELRAEARRDLASSNAGR